MKTLILIFLGGLAAAALPLLDVDGITVPADDPRIGALVIVQPGSEWLVWGNDNPPPKFGDRDYNDGVARIVFGDDGSGTAHWGGSWSSWKNYWLIAGGVVGPNISTSWGPQEIGSLLPIYFHTQDGARYAIGHRNILTDRIDEVPEPGTAVFTFFGIGLLLLTMLRNTGAER